MANNPYLENLSLKYLHRHTPLNLGGAVSSMVDAQ